MNVSPGEPRPGRSLRHGWALASLAWMGLIFGLSSVPGPAFPHSVDFLSRFATLAHFVLYAVLGLLLASAFGRRDTRTLALVVAIASLYGVSDEMHQIFVPGRSPDPVDWLADTLGAIAAAAVFAKTVRQRSMPPAS